MTNKKDSKGIFDRFRDDVSGMCAADIKNHSEICAADIIAKLEKSDLACKEDVLQYLNDNKVPKYSDDDLRRILQIQKRIDDMEVEQDSLVQGYRLVIKICLALSMLFLFLVVCCVFYVVFCNPLVYSFSEAASPVLNIVLLVATVIYIPMAFIVVKHKYNLALLSIYFVSFGVLLVYAIGVTCFGSAPRVGVVNFICCGLLVIFSTFYSAADTLNKSDSYNVMILIFTLLALAIGIYSLMLTMGQ